MLCNKTLNCTCCGNPRKHYPGAFGKNFIYWLRNEVRLSRSLKALEKQFQDRHHIFKVPIPMEIDLSRPRHLFARFENPRGPSTIAEQTLGRIAEFVLRKALENKMSKFWANVKDLNMMEITLVALRLQCPHYGVPTTPGNDIGKALES